MVESRSTSLVKIFVENEREPASCPPHRCDTYLLVSPPFPPPLDIRWDNSTYLTRGFEVYSLLYNAARYYTKLVADTDAVWNANRDKLGMINLTRAAATDMYGNSFILLQLTRLSGYDWRPFFEVRGIPLFSDTQTLMARLVSRLQSEGRYKGNISTDFANIGYNLPERNMSQGFKWIPLDGVSPWLDPKTGAAIWTPNNCSTCDPFVCTDCPPGGGCLKVSVCLYLCRDQCRKKKKEK
jgi:hypothetical protein